MTKKEVLEFLKKNPNGLEGTEFIVRRVVKTEKKTFEVEQVVLDDFLGEARKRKMKIKDAVGEALAAWVKAKP